MATEFDMFFTFRWLLAIVCTVYAVVCIWRSWVGWLMYFRSGRRTAVLGHYAMVLLLRVRIRRFSCELFQIAALLAILGWLVYVHRWVEGAT
ncbi:MAG: hypothetical protein GXY55_03655 [Phycisphaerae bacterium]|nr:hypothetical protein [Phycisphaerae bacterium]